MKINIFFSIITVALMAGFGCQSAASSTSPSVTTDPVTNITYTSATSGGNVTSDGGDVISDQGICWSTNPSPTTSDSKTSEGTNPFTSNMTGLFNNTTYYTRAFATNSQGTSYGNEEVFNTLLFDNTIWDIVFVEDSAVAFNYVPKVKIIFNDDGTTISEDHDYPGIFYNGTWSINGLDVDFDSGLDPLVVSYIFNGTITGTDMGGSYTWGATGSKVFIAEKRP